MASVKQPLQTTPVGADLAKDEVTVLDPHHPLFGCTFPLVRIVGEDEDKRSCVVRLPSAVERLIPIEATDHSPNPIKTYPLLLSVAAIKRLLEIYERVKSQPEEPEEEVPSVPELADEPVASAEVTLEEDAHVEQEWPAPEPDVIPAEFKEGMPLSSEKVLFNAREVNKP